MDQGWSLLLACWWAELLPKGEAAMHQMVVPADLKEAVKTTKREKIDTFSSNIIHDQMKMMLLGKSMHVLSQVLKGGDGSHLPYGLNVVNRYTKVISWGKWVAVVVKNLMAIPISIAKGDTVAKVIAENVVPPVELEELDEMQGYQVEERSAHTTTRFIWPRVVVWGKPSDHPCLISWVLWHSH